MKIKLLTASAILLLVASCASPKTGSEVNVHKVDGQKNVAIKGYDPVAYFTKKAPVKGEAKYSHKYQGANWHFSSRINKDKFAKNPKKYAPKYGGYCAYGVSVPQKKIDIEPEAWTIHKGKLYLNYTPRTKKIWLSNKEEHIVDANENWPEVKKQ